MMRPGYSICVGVIIRDGFGMGSRMMIWRPKYSVSRPTLLYRRMRAARASGNSSIAGTLRRRKRVVVPREVDGRALPRRARGRSAAITSDLLGGELGALKQRRKLSSTTRPNQRVTPCLPGRAYHRDGAR